MKRALLIVAGLILVAAIGLTFFVHDKGPSHQGRSLGGWLQDYGSSACGGGGLAHNRFLESRPQSLKGSPADAIRAIGTNAIKPLLAEIKRPSEPSWLVSAKRFVARLTSGRLVLSDSLARREQAAAALFDLGPIATSAIPELTQLLNDYSTATLAAHALAGMGTNAIPAFVTALTNSNTWVNDCGAWGLAQLGPESRALAPQIISLFKTGNSADDMLVLWALGEIREPVELIRPELQSRLRDPDPQIRQFAARALTKFGPAAKPAEEQIKAALTNETNSDTRAALQESLKVITWNLEVAK